MLFRSSPSRIPSFRPSRGEIVTICTIQKTQIKCLANDCEWRNQRRKCRDFVKREDIVQQNTTSAPYASESGTPMPPMNGVPTEDPVARAFVIVALCIGSVVVLVIVAYVGKHRCVGRKDDLSPKHEGEASLLADMYGRDPTPVAAATPPRSTWLSSPPAASHNDNGVQEAYIKSND